MKILCLPSNQIFKYFMTGKFKAPSPDWKHENFYLGEYELFVMTEGTLYISHNQERFTVNAGEYLILPPQNSWRNGFKQAYCSFYWLHFTTAPGNIPMFVPTVENSDYGNLPLTSYFTIPQTGKIPKLEKIVILMKQLQDLVKNNYPAIAIDALTTSIITELFGQLSLAAPIDTSLASQKQIYLDIMDYVKLNNNRNIRISEIADHFGYNEKYLSHLFAKLTGIPLKQYILNQKIDAANFMLTDTNKPISDIAKELGYPDVHNFSRMYKKVTGLTPSDFRNAYAKRLLFHV